MLLSNWLLHFGSACAAFGPGGAKLKYTRSPCYIHGSVSAGQEKFPRNVTLKKNWRFRVTKPKDCNVLLFTGIACLVCLKHNMFPSATCWAWFGQKAVTATGRLRCQQSLPHHHLPPGQLFPSFLFPTLPMYSFHPA